MSKFQAISVIAITISFIKILLASDIPNELNAANIYISNSGITAFIKMIVHDENDLEITFNSKSGKRYFSQSFHHAALFDFSSCGNKFGVGTDDEFYALKILDGNVDALSPADQFDFSQVGDLLALARINKIQIYKNTNLLREIENDFTHAI